MASTLNEKPENHRSWHTATHRFSIFSEACNSGIVIHIIDMFHHSIMLVAYGAFAFFAHYADAAIYIFKSLIRATKALGRHCFDIEFEEDVKKHAHIQTTLDLIAMLFFISTIVLLTAVSTSIAPTIAWISALIGLTIVGYSDYYLTQKDSKENLDSSLQELLELTKQFIHQTELAELVDSVNLDEKFKAIEINYQSYQIKNKSYKLYVMLVAGLSALLICSSATIFATGIALVIMDVLAKVASAYLACLAIFRFHNYLQSKSMASKNNESESFTSWISKNSNKNQNSQELITQFAQTRELDLDFKDCQALKTF